MAKVSGLERFNYGRNWKSPSLTLLCFQESADQMQVQGNKVIKLISISYKEVRSMRLDTCMLILKEFGEVWGRRWGGDGLVGEKFKCKIERYCTPTRPVGDQRDKSAHF